MIVGTHNEKAGRAAERADVGQQQRPTRVGHKNAPLTPEGRKRLINRIRAGRPISHVAAEAGVSRATVSKWYGRWLEHGDRGLLDQSSKPGSSPSAIDEDVVDLIVKIRREQKWGPARIAAHILYETGLKVAPATVHRTLVRQGLNRLVNMDLPTGELARGIVRYEHDAAGSLLHMDVKKLGKIPTGGGSFVHALNTAEYRASRTKAAREGGKSKHVRVGATYVHTAIDDYSRIAYSECLDNEQGITTAEFWFRAVTFFAEFGITPIQRVLTDNGANYRSNVFAAALATTGTVHKRTKPYTPQTNGKVERFNGTLVREWSHVRGYTSEQERRDALMPFLNFYNLERPHSALKHKPPATRAPGKEFRLTVRPVPVIEQIRQDGVRGQLSLEDLDTTS